MFNKRKKREFSNVDSGILHQDGRIVQHDNMNHIRFTDTYTELRSIHPSSLLAILYRAAKKNEGKSPQGNRYEEI